MSQDLAAILGGGSSAKAPKSAPKTYEAFDAALRTVYAENPKATDDEARAIASVIVNRSKKSGKDVGAVVQEAGQFEPWADDKGRKRIESLAADSPDYARLSGVVGPILRGEADPSVPYTHFYAPKAQAALKRDKPEWDDGTGTQVGDHLFFTQGAEGNLGKLLGGSGAPQVAAANADVDDAYRKAFGAAGSTDAEPTGITPFAGMSENVTKGQQAFHDAHEKGGGYDPEAPDGSAANPRYMPNGVTEKDVKPGEFYVTRQGKLKKAPGGADDKPGGFLEGMSRGAGDVMLSAAQLAPGTDDSVLKNRFFTDQQEYNAEHGGEFKAGAGRFAGQVLTSAPLLAGGEAALAPAAARLGITGLAAEAPVLNRIIQGGKVVAKGMAEGAGAAALTSSATDAPLGEQVLTGAVTGGVAAPVAKVAGKAARRFFGGAPAEGGAPAAEQAALAERASGLPVPVMLDAGQMSRAPAASGEVNALLKGAEGDLPAAVVKGFRSEQQGALRGNVQAIGDAIAGREVTPGSGAEAVSATLNARRDVMKKTIDKAYDVARVHGEDAMLATAKDVREGIITGLKTRFTESKIGSVLGEVEKLGAEGSPTARQLYETRERLSGLTQEGGVEGTAARAARNGLDEYIKGALRNDLFIGDPKAISLWRQAIAKRAEFGKLFEGGDLIDEITERTNRGGEHGTLKVDPAEAVNYILGREGMSFATKPNLTRDLFRLRDVLGKESEEWNGLRAEVFMRMARAGEGSPEAGQAQFSGQKFLKAWDAFNEKNPRLVKGMFTEEERDLIDRFADVAQAATTPVKGGDNTSNTAIAAKQMLGKLAGAMSVGGGAAGGGAVGGVPGAAMGAIFGSFMKDVKSLLAAGKARRLTYGAKPNVSNEGGLQNKLLGPLAPTAAAVAGNRLLGAQ